MIRFPGLDGLRGWLAWTVVLHHVVFFGGLGAAWLPRDVILGMGSIPVKVFVILSGFVIAHLVVEKDEPYGRYLARRALRIYPIYLLALFMGIGATFLSFATFLTPEGVPDPAALATIPYPHVNSMLFDRQVLHTGTYFVHLLLHLTMLHGLFAQNVLPDSEFMFLAPAWSLSLEWQFYLVAPFVVRAARHKLAAIGMLATTLGLFHLYASQRFGWWSEPSFLPGAAPYFAIGIASRLLVARFSRWAAASVAILAVGFAALGGSIWPVALWFAFLAASVVHQPDGRWSADVGRVFGALFESRAARHLGQASYSTYLVHFPLLQVATYIAVRLLALGPAAASLFVAAATLASTYGVSRLTWRLVEQPFIAYGKRSGDKDQAKESLPASSH